MNLQDVIERFALISGLNQEEVLKWTTLCSDSLSDVESKVKASVNKQTVKIKISYIAAALAYYRYSLYIASCAGSDGFSIGDLRINGSSKSNVLSAEKMYKEALSTAVDILEDKNFLFMKVEP